MDIVTLIRDQLEALLSEHVDRKLLRAAEAGEWPERLWSAIVEFGLPTALLPEDHGGSALTWADAGAIFHLTGRFVAPIPLGETMIAARVLTEAGIAVPDGPLAIADGSALTDAGGLLSGTIDAAAWGGRAHLVVDTETGVHLLAPGSGDGEAVRTIGRDERRRVRLAAVRPLTSATPHATNPAGRIAELGAMLRASQMAGALRRVLDLSLDYANTRQQFGRPIGRFQAVQQSLAQLAAEVAAAEVAAAAAWAARDNGTAAFEAAVAKIRTGEAARIGAAIAHQVHGAIGVTDEHMLHYATRRLWSWRQEFGTEAAWAERLGRAVINRPGDQLWPLLTREISA